MSDRKAFKDYFDASAARALARQVKSAWLAFDDRAYVRKAARGLADLEMMDRVRQFSNCLKAFLPADSKVVLEILENSLPDLLEHCDSPTDGFLQWPLGQFVADHTVHEFDASMKFMIALTQRLTSEFAVRPFLEHYPERTFARLLGLTAHQSPHVRRWCSEGTRPRLPWGRRLHALVADPTPILPILERLRDDPESYVRRSVANNLNDIAKDHPNLVISICRRWRKNATKERAAVIRHALRSLVKAGNPQAISLLGFDTAQDISATLRLDRKRVSLGDAVKLTLTLENRGDNAVSCLVDYAVHHVKANGSTTPSVFKWTAVPVAPRSRVTLEKKHRLRTTTTRTLYPGRHKFHAQVNGSVVSERFILLTN